MLRLPARANALFLHATTPRCATGAPSDLRRAASSSRRSSGSQHSISAGPLSLADHSWRLQLAGMLPGLSWTAAQTGGQLKAARRAVWGDLSGCGEAAAVKPRFVGTARCFLQRMAQLMHRTLSFCSSMVIPAAADHVYTAGQVFMAFQWACCVHSTPRTCRRARMVLHFHRPWDGDVYCTVYESANSMSMELQAGSSPAGPHTRAPLHAHMYTAQCHTLPPALAPCASVFYHHPIRHHLHVNWVVAMPQHWH